MGAIAGIAGGVLGAVGGAAGTQESQTTRRILRPASQLETESEALTRRQLSSFEELQGAGAGRAEVAGGLQQQQAFASQLEQTLATGGLPSQAQQAQAGQFASDIFAPERQAVQAGFAEQGQRVNQLAAQLGRQVNDPILQAKLAQSQQQQLGAVGARETQFRAQTAQQLPFQQLQLGQALSGVRQGLASQAFTNRQTLFGLGQQALSGEKSFRLS